MAQDKYLFNGKNIVQPDRGLGYDFETTYSEDTTRLKSGGLHETALFTVESLAFKATNIPIAKVAALLSEVVGKRFQFHYLSAYYGTWRTDTFYVGKGTMEIGEVIEGKEIASIAFNVVGVNKVV